MNPFMNFLAQTTIPVEQAPAVDDTTNSTLSPGTMPPPPVGTEEPPAAMKIAPYFPLIVGILILYIFIFRSKKNKDRTKQDMLLKMKKGDRVQTIGGILGTIVDVRDNEIVLKVDEGSNTKIKFTRAAIHKVVEDEK